MSGINRGPLLPFTPSALYPILDAAVLPEERTERERLLAAAAATLAASGVTLLQYRNKRDGDARFIEDARVLRGASPAAMQIILNDRAHLVAATGCDGVHVGQEDLPVDSARLLLGAEKIVGLSTHSEEQLREGNRTTADYLAIGPIYATGSKPDAEPVVGLDGLRRARSLTAKPLVAIGGIRLAHAAEVRAAGADSLAVISALFGGPGASGSLSEPAVLQKLAEDFLSVFR